MDGDALEFALGLYRAPTHRFELLGRPLPGDIDKVIQLATGSQPQLREAAAMSGETEQTILEAVRFYLQQVLFQPDADAYRVLGLAADAEPERIRRHYRWLQSWLHPDRRGEEWEALLATRVNWAWRHLRTEVARRQYAAGGEARDAIQSADSDAYTPLRTHEWVPASPLPRPASWSRRIALAISLGICLGLLVLGLTLRDAKVSDDFAPPDTKQGDARRDTAVKPASPDLPLIKEPVQPQVATESVSAVHDIAQGSTAAVTPDATSTVEQQTPIADTAQEQVHIPAPATPVSLPVVADIQSPPIAAIQPVWPTTSEVAQSTQAGVDHLPHVDKIRGAGVPLESRRVTAENIERRDSRLQRSQPAPLTPPGSIDAVHLKETEVPSPPESAPNVAVADRATLAVLVQKSSAQAATNAVMPTEDAFARFDLARQRIGEVAAYLGNARLKPPPVWNDVRGQMNAEQQRAALLERNQARASGGFEVETPIWKISKEAAALSADYRLRRGSSVAERGRIVMDMIWREKMWLVTRVELSPAQ